MSNKRKGYSSLTSGLGFLFLGITTGFIVGISGSSAVEAIVAALFALVGSSSVAFVVKLNPRLRELAGFLILVVSLGVIVGLLTGIYIDRHQLLGPKIRLTKLEDVIARVAHDEIIKRQKEGKPISIQDLSKLLTVAGNSKTNPYLNSQNSELINSIIQQEAAGVLTQDQAFHELKEALQSQ